MKVTLVIAASGNIDSVDLDLQNIELVHCVQQELATSTFPPSHDKRTIVVPFRIVGVSTPRDAP